MARGIPDCVLCGEPILRASDACRWLTGGWVPQRTQGGGHNVRLPEYGPQWAHDMCVDAAVLAAKRRAGGLHDQQGAWEF